jgi:hypothetical protein
MRRILMCLLLMAPWLAFGQSGVWVSSAVLTSSTAVPQGAQAPVFTYPYSVVTVCGYPASSTTATCTNTVPIFSDQAMLLPITQPLTADIYGRFGFFIGTGTYSYCVSSPITTGSSFLGCYTISVGGGGVSGGITSINAQTGPAITIACGTGLLCSTVANTITISTNVDFAITSFGGCAGTVELGTSIVNPSFTASYSTPPASASITNTEGIGSPLTLTTPFTSGSVIGTFVHTSVETTTFMLSATQGSTQTASCSDVWKPAIFGGVGAAGASATVTASGTTAVLSTGDSLARAQFGSETFGEEFGPYTASNQVVYLLLTGGTHTFIDANTGFPFAFNAPVAVTFVNAHGTPVSMFFYSSTNPLFGTFLPKVES